MTSKPPAGGSGAERRAAPRVPVAFNVRFSAGRIEGIGSIRDLSLNGAYIAAAPPHPRRGAAVGLFFSVGEESAPVKIAAEVVRHTGVGFSVRFAKLDQRLQDVLIAVLPGLTGQN